MAQDNNTGVISPTPASLGLGCGTAYSNNRGSYAPRYTPYRSGQIRKHQAVQMDISILKRTKITERTSFQFGFEAFNFLNHNYFGRTDLNTDPNSAAFGSVLPSTVSTQNMMPRQIQMRFKFYWQRQAEGLGALAYFGDRLRNLGTPGDRRVPCGHQSVPSGVSRLRSLSPK